MIHLNDHPPANVHALNADGQCRVVLDPEIKLDKFWNMKAIDAREAVRLATQHLESLRAEWERIHGTRK